MVLSELRAGVVSASGTPRTSGRRVIVCIVATEWAQQLAVQAITGAGAASMVGPHITNVVDNDRDAWSGLIYDLAPWDQTACVQLQQIRSNRPELPVLLYIPPHDAAFSLIPQCAKLTAVSVRVQQRSSGAVAELREEVLRLLRTESKEHLMGLLSGALPQRSTLVRAFLEESLDLLSAGARPRVERLAARLRVSRRTLERSFAHEELPTPKEMTDWLTFLWLAYVSYRHEQPLAQVARSIHIRSHDLYHLRRRLAQRAEISSWHLSEDTVSMIVFELRKRCATAKG